MPDYSFDSIINGKGEDLIEIGFAVEGYEVENVRGRKVIQQTANDGGFGAASGSVPVSVGGYIDDEASKQLVVTWSNHQSIVVKIAEDSFDKYTICKCNIETKYGLPSTFENDYVTGRSNFVKAARYDNNEDWFCGIMVTTTMLLNYIKHYYPNCDWNDQIIQGIISKKIMCAQICFATSGTGVYFNATVVDSPPTGIGDTAITIDTQLFLSLDNIKNDFEVTAADKSGKTEKVGVNIKPQETTDYTYQAAALGSYTKLYTSHSQPSEWYNGGCHFTSVSVTSPKYQQARIRFFIHPDIKDEIQQLLGDKTIPEGLIGEPTAYYTEAFVPSGVATMGDGTWPYFPPQYADGRALNAENYTKACRIMWFYEIGNCDVTPESLAAGVSTTVDNAGINFGPFQTNRTGINRVLKYYCTKVDTTSEASKILAANWMNREITKADQSNPELVNNLKKISIENFNGTMVACTASWADEYYLPTAIRWYKKAGFDCAMGLAMCMYIINNGTGITSHGDSLPSKVAGISDQLAKCKFVAEAWRTGNSTKSYIENYATVKKMWQTFCAGGDINLTGSYNWSQWHHSGRPF